jgi:hypothetical protein
MRRQTTVIKKPTMQGRLPSDLQPLSISIKLHCSAPMTCTVRISVTSPDGQSPSGSREAASANPFQAGDEHYMAKKKEHVWSDPFRRIPLRTSFSEYRHNGRRRFRAANEHETSVPSSLSRFVPIYRHHAAVFARYCAERRLNPKQLHTIEALYMDGLSLRELAKLDRVRPQAITGRINAMATKGAAVEFCQWWRRVNAPYQRPRLATSTRRRAGGRGRARGRRSVPTPHD